MFISTEHWNWDVWKREDHDNDVQKDHSTVPHCEDEDFNASHKTKIYLVGQTIVWVETSPLIKIIIKSIFLQMDADYNPTLMATSKKKRKKKMLKTWDLPHSGEKRKKSLFAEVIARKKPVFDPSKCSYFALGHTLIYVVQVIVVSVQMKTALNSTWMSTTRWTMRML